MIIFTLMNSIVFFFVVCFVCCFLGSDQLEMILFSLRLTFWEGQIHLTPTCFMNVLWSQLSYLFPVPYFISNTYSNSGPTTVQCLSSLTGHNAPSSAPEGAQHGSESGPKCLQRPVALFLHTSFTLIANYVVMARRLARMRIDLAVEPCRFWAVNCAVICIDTKMLLLNLLFAIDQLFPEQWMPFSWPRAR